MNFNTEFNQSMRILRKYLGFSNLFYSQKPPFEQIVDLFTDLRGSDVLPKNAHDLTPHQAGLLQFLAQNGLLNPQSSRMTTLPLDTGTTFHDYNMSALDRRGYARGTSWSSDESIARGVGELLERTPFRATAESPEIIASQAQMRSLKNQTIPLDSFPQPTKTQFEKFPEFQITQDTPIGWNRVRSYEGELEFWAPTSMVYWGYRPTAGEGVIQESNSNGIGAGYTQQAALSSAMCELLQRHAFFKKWYFNISPKRFDIENICSVYGEQSILVQSVRGIHNYGFTIHFLEFTDEVGIPSVCCILTKKDMGLYVGMSTQGTYEAAFQRAAAEALSIYSWCMSCSAHDGYAAMTRSSTRKFPQNDFLDRNFSDKDRVLLYQDSIYAKGAECLFAGDVVPFTSERAQENHFFREIESALRACTKNMYVRFAHETYLDALGFFAVRVIADNMYQLALAEYLSRPILNGREVPNTRPHPFP
jgi:thiazole/oxazole-forming peptide maturase SagD family component